MNSWKYFGRHYFMNLCFETQSKYMLVYIFMVRTSKKLKICLGIKITLHQQTLMVHFSISYKWKFPTTKNEETSFVG